MAAKAVKTLGGFVETYRPKKPTKSPRNRPGRKKRKPYRGQGKP